MKLPNQPRREFGSPEELLEHIKKSKGKTEFSSQVGDDNVHIHILCHTCICTNCIKAVTELIGMEQSVICDELEKITEIRNYINHILSEGEVDYLVLTLNKPIFNLKNMIYLGTLDLLIKMTESLRKQGAF